MLAATGEKVSTSRIASRLDVAQASVTGMIKKLAEMKLLDYSPYRGVSLTTSGKKIALETIRHHRLLELYLQEAMGYTWDKVHEEAEKLEHHISEEFEEKMDEVLGFPSFDPHGAPIPTKDGEIPERDLKPLTEIPLGQKVVIALVQDEDPEKLRYLGERKLYPKTEIEVVEQEPFNGPLQIIVGVEKCQLGRELCETIFVETPPKAKA
mgnify:CR=1 FL=1